MDSILIGRVRRIDIRMNWSVLVIAGLIAYSLAESILPEDVSGRSAAAYWITGSITAVAFFGALIAHELGHSLVAQREGVEVKGITLWLLGGVAMLGSDPPSSRAALRIAAAGPIVSTAIGVVALSGSSLLGGLTGSALTWFGAINLLLAAFNLIPAYPLDGGRIYQAVQWGRTGDDLAATRMAVRLGRGIGVLLIVIGVIEALAGAPIGGIWLVFIGWFVREAGRSELRHKAIAGPLRALRVEDVMTVDPVTVESTMALTSFIPHVMQQGRHTVYPVEAAGRLVGAVDMKRVIGAAGGHAGRTVADVMTPLDGILCVAPDTPLTDLLERLNDRVGARAFVCTDGRAVGLISPTDVARLIGFLEMTARPGTVEV